MADNLSSYNPKETEEKIYRLWEESGFFSPQFKKQNNKKFIVMMAPPNITGNLHMGHFLENTITDILVRQKRMQGFETLWLPGTDHAGIATQNVVEKDLKKQGLSRWKLGREKFIEKVWEWREKYGNIILDQFKKIGISADWSRQSFTLDKKYAKAVIAAFIRYHKKGYLYRAERVVNWCTHCETSLSELELEHKENKTNLWYLKYPVKNSKQFAIVATTRPETMLGDAAVAVNPKDERYKSLIGQKIILPIQNREIPIIADPLIDINFGTGAVKVTPAHDMVDAELGEKHKLEFIKVINEQGKITSSAGSEFEGLKVEDARQKVIEDLNKLGLVEKIEDYSNNIAVCYRCNSIIEPIPSMQWFLKMSELAKIAENAVKEKRVSILPKKWEKPYFAWLKNIRDWCISRQIWWGHQLPVWFCATNKNQYIVSEIKPEQCPFCKKCGMKQSEDVLDTWFSSALWPFATLGWPEKTDDLNKYYPTTFMTSAREILHLWITRMIFSGLELLDEVPFKTVHIHPTVLNKDGRRMSKSLGTGIDPLELIEKYGADACRFGIMWQNRGSQDIKYGEEHFIAGKKFANKFWNACRFVLLNINLKIPTLGKPDAKTKDDEMILKNLIKVQKDIEKNIEKFYFGQALEKFYEFFWRKFCDKYLETSKKQLQNPELNESTQKILFFVIINSLKLLHPFMPFITEEIYQKLPVGEKKLLMIEEWPI